MKTQKSFLLAVATLFMISGIVACSSDSIPPAKDDTGVVADQTTSDTVDVDGQVTPDAADDAVVTDAPVADAFINECEGATDGDKCEKDTKICLNEQCVTSVCGDGFVDSATEDCEDGNFMDGDGCTECKYDCTKNADCDDGQICNGAETCNTDKHKCTAGNDATDGTICDLNTTDKGECNGGVCVAADCGDGNLNNGEECDDGNSVNNDGCENDCTITCTADKDCDDGDLCNGKETCTKSNTCVAGTPVVCDDGCTGTCFALTGTCRYPDNDGDGFGCNKDCNDKDSAIYPGAIDCNDGKDNDCDKAIDEDNVPCKCYKDADGDGFAASGASTKDPIGGICSKGYTAVEPITGTTDCWDLNADLKPTQTAYFEKEYCFYFNPVTFQCASSTFDYNCDGDETQQYTAISSKKCTFIGGGITRPVCLGSGWTGVTKAPACGEKADFLRCYVNKLQTGCDSSTDPKIQACH